MAKTTEEIKLQQDAYDRYMQQANSIGLSADYVNKIKNGSLDLTTIKDEDLSEKIKNFMDMYNKALDAKDAVDQLKISIKDLTQTKFDMFLKKFEGSLNAIEHRTSMLEGYVKEFEARGYAISGRFYEALKDTEFRNLDALATKREGAIKLLQESINNGTVIKGTEKFAEMTAEIDEITRAMQDASVAIVDYNRQIREMDEKKFDIITSKMKALNTEADFLIDLLTDDEAYDEAGKLTDRAQAIIGLHAMNYTAYMAEADKYASEIAKVNQQLKDTPLDMDLMNRRQDLIEMQQESILAAKKEKEAVQDLTKQGIDKQIDSMDELIGKYSKSLDVQKDLYAYSKKIKEQTRNIQNLQKQLTAYEGDNSEEAKAQIQRIKVDLEKARDDIRETEYDYMVDSQQRMLDSFYEDYEKFMNQKMDNIEVVMLDMIKYTNENSTLIAGTINDSADAVGYKLSGDMYSIWNSAGSIGNVVAEYGSSFNAGVSTTNNILSKMTDTVEKMYSELSNLAQYRMNQQGSTSVSESGEIKNPPPPPPPPPTPPASDKQKLVVGGTYNMSKSTAGYYTSPNAISRVDSTGQYGAGQYTVYKIVDGAANLTKKPGTPGAWFNIADLEAEMGSGSAQPGSDIFIPKKYTGNKSALNIQYSVVDRLEYFDFQAYGGVLEKYYKGLGFNDTYYGTAEQNTRILNAMKAMGYASGKRRIVADELAWTQELGGEMIIRPTDNAILTPMKAGDSVLKASATNTIFDFANNPAEFLKSFSYAGLDSPNMIQNSNDTYNNDVNFNFTLPNVVDANSLKNELINNPEIQRVIETMTIGRLNGKSSNQKYKFR